MSELPTRTPDGHINNCSLYNGEDEKDCQMCGGKCPDRESRFGFKDSQSSSPKDAVESPPKPVPVSSLPGTIGSLLASWCARYRALGRQIAPLKTEQDTLKDDIEELALAQPYKSIEGVPEEGSEKAPWRTTRAQRTTTRLDTVLVSEEATRRNIDPVDVIEIIKFATVQTKGEEYVTITDPSQERKHKSKASKSNTESDLFD